MAKQQCRYLKSESILLCDKRREISLSDEDLATLYRFYVLEAPNSNQSDKSISFESRGWSGGLNNSDLKARLTGVLDLYDSGDFFFSAGESIKKELTLYGLVVGKLNGLGRERGVFGVTQGSSLYQKCFYHLRNCFAHGNFKLVDSNEGPVFLCEDRERGEHSPNITARFVIKKQTLLDWVDAVVSST